MLTSLTFRVVASVLVAAAILHPNSGTAAPADEIQYAVNAGGALTVQSATPSQFVMAFSALVIRIPAQKLPEYVTAGITARTTLAGQITEAALRVERSKQNGKEALDDCHWLDAILRAAIAAAPKAKEEIVRAALEAEPYSRDCIFAAAGMRDGEGDSAFFRPNGVDAGNINSTAIGTINPGNFSGQGNIVSPFRP